MKLNLNAVLNADTLVPTLPTSAELWQLYQKSGPAAENALVQFYLPLVRSTLSRLGGTLPDHVDRDDLHSAGMLGLLGAMRKFDPTCGVPFDSYARPRIRGAMQDELRRMDWLPRSIHQKARLVEKTTSRLEQQLGRAPTSSEAAAAMDISPDEYDELVGEIRPAQFVQLDSTVHGEDEMLLAEVIAHPAQADPVEQVSTLELKEVVLEILKQLPVAQRKVLSLYYIEGLLLQEIAAAMGVTESRVSQIHTQALTAVRAHVRRYENGMVTAGCVQ
jgi:RNA polymerase sigma factor for flagellar operon FliA